MFQKGDINEDITITVISLSKPKPKPENIDNQSKTNEEYDGFLDMDFMPKNVVPLNVINHDAFFEGEIPQSSHSDVAYDADQVIPRKRKAPFSEGAKDVEAGSSSAPDNFLVAAPSKKSKPIVI